MALPGTSSSSEREIKQIDISSRHCVGASSLMDEDVNITSLRAAESGTIIRFSKSRHRMKQWGGKNWLRQSKSSLNRVSFATEVTREPRSALKDDPRTHYPCDTPKARHVQEVI